MEKIGSSGVGVDSSLNRTVREGFIEKMTFVQRPNGQNIAPFVLSWERESQAEETVNAEALRGSVSDLSRNNEAE